MGYLCWIVQPSQKPILVTIELITTDVHLIPIKWHQSLAYSTIEYKHYLYYLSRQFCQLTHHLIPVSRSSPRPAPTPADLLLPRPDPESEPPPGRGFNLHLKLRTPDYLSQPNARFPIPTLTQNKTNQETKGDHLISKLGAWLVLLGRLKFLRRADHSP